MSLVAHPNKQEVELAEQIKSNLASIAKKLPPAAIASGPGIRKALGMSSIGTDEDYRTKGATFRIISGSKESLVDTTPMDMDLEPPAVTTFDNELRDLLGTE